jgi:uncharacterized Fe-S cluster-containing radical SAM superfamily enzyme
MIYVDKNSDIPLYGVDFIGIIDRGTNILEIKPLTLCNLKCRYCFVRAGDYKNNFILSSNYLLESIKDALTIKGNYDIEIHIAPYGETLLYPELDKLIQGLWQLKGIERISMQSNGLLLDDLIINKLEELKLTRINISLNTFNEKKAKYLCDCESYDVETLLKSIKTLLNTEINVLLAPVWFPGKNDEDIERIIEYVINLRNSGYSEQKIQIGIQKYLIYKTGRKFKRVRPKTWDYFYSQLTILEKKYKIKLKLGPKDFGITKRVPIIPLDLKKNTILNAKIISKGRWDNEFIGKISKNVGIKILLHKKFQYSGNLIGKEVRVKIIKTNYKDNILTAIFPP